VGLASRLIDSCIFRAYSWEHPHLEHAGYDGWTKLRTRHDRDDFPTVQVYKTAERIKVEAEGYTIIANARDQISDIEGMAAVQGVQPLLLHPVTGTDLPDGLPSRKPVQPLLKKYSGFPKTQITLYPPPSRPDQRGVGHRRERWGGLWWTRQRRVCKGFP
jgi:hypothetical protein